MSETTKPTNAGLDQRRWQPRVVRGGQLLPLFAGDQVIGAKGEVLMILAERITASGIRWVARRDDRGRLQVEAIVSPSLGPTIVPLLTDAELRELLAEGTSPTEAFWVCLECRSKNPRERRWCSVCSGHDAA